MTPSNAQQGTNGGDDTPKMLKPLPESELLRK
jgi:hypothetical protein